MVILPKLHKRQYKARFIANSSSCTTTELSKLLTSCLTAIKKHLIKYCETVYERSGKNLLWSIKNSGEVLNKLVSRGFCVASMSTYDFSTLYTALPHNLIKEKVTAHSSPSKRIQMLDRTKRPAPSYPSDRIAILDRTKRSAPSSPSERIPMLDRTKRPAPSSPSEMIPMLDRTKRPAPSSPRERIAMLDRTKRPAPSYQSVRIPMLDRTKRQLPLLQVRVPQC